MKKKSTKPRKRYTARPDAPRYSPEEWAAHLAHHFTAPKMDILRHLKYHILVGKDGKLSAIECRRAMVGCEGHYTRRGFPPMTPPKLRA